MNTRIIFALWVFAMLYFIYRIFNNRRAIYSNNISSKMDEIINSDKYKPKGQYDKE